MKKNFLFGLLAILLAGFWFGGASLAEDVAKIGNWACGEPWITCYDNLTDAITAWWDIEIIKAGEYSLPTSLVGVTSIKKADNVEWVVTLNISAWIIANGGEIISINNDITFEWVTINVQSAHDWIHFGNTTNTITMSQCVINGVFYIRWDMEFNGCTFNGGSSYQIHINYWNVNFDSCTFNTTASRFINIAWGWDAEYNVNFKDSTFSTTATDAKKAAVMIHEIWNQTDGYAATNTPTYHRGITDKVVTINWKEHIPWKWIVTFENTTVEGGFSESYIGNNKLYWIDSIYVNDKTTNQAVPSVDPTKVTLSDYSIGSLNWGEVRVNDITNNRTYETPSKAVAKIWTTNYATLEDAITAWWDIEIVKAGEYPLPTSLAGVTSIKKADNVEWVVTLNISGAWKTNGQALVTLNADITFEWLTINFVSTDSWKYLNNTTKVTMKHCKIQWVMYVRWNMDFEDCTFEGASSDAYQIHINYGNVNFSGCTFNTEAKRFINIAWWWDGEYTIKFKNSTFSTIATAVKKAAVMVHELRGAYATDDPFDFRQVTDFEIIWGKGYGKWKWNLIFDNTVIADGSNFSDAYIWNSQLFGVDTVYVNDFDGTTYTYAAPVDPTDGWVNLDYLGSENWGEVNVTVNWTKVYSTPKRGQTWKVTFDWTWDQVVADGAKVAQPADPSKSCYHFDGWYNGNTAYDFNSVVTWNLALTSKWNSTCSSSSSSSSSSSKKTTTKTDTKATTWDTAKVDDKKTEETSTEDKSEVVDWTDANTNTNDTNVNENRYKDSDWDGTLDNGLTKELVDAYVFAHENGITTMNSPEEADMFGPLTRIAMAKMLSQYAINVLGKTPDTTRTISFPDVSAELDAQYDNGVTLAYQLGIMWIWIDKFRPDDLVTRAEFGTALSRMLFGLADGEELYYETHLQKLMDEKIITNNNPDLQELRGYVMIMLMRSAQ